MKRILITLVSGITVYRGAPVSPYCYSRIAMKASQAPSLSVGYISGEDSVENIDYLMGRFAPNYQGNQVALCSVPGMDAGEVLEILKEASHDLYIIAPSSIASGNYADIETGNSVGGQFVADLNKITKELNLGIILTHHVNKNHATAGESRQSARGASAIIGNARMGNGP